MKEFFKFLVGLIGVLAIFAILIGFIAAILYGIGLIAVWVGFAVIIGEPTTVEYLFWGFYSTVIIVFSLCALVLLIYLALSFRDEVLCN